MSEPLYRSPVVPTEVSPKNPAELKLMQAILGKAVAVRGPRDAIHPGELAFWVYHSDPRTEEAVSYWLDGDQGFVVLDTSNQLISAFCVPEHSPISLIKWGQGRMGPDARVAGVSTADRALEADLEQNGYEMAGISGPVFIRNVTGDRATPASPPGLTLRPLSGEEEADSRRRASHAAFKSTMDPTQHLERYLRFMRSPVYEAERDLVAVTPDGTVASFVIWWPDPSGVAQIEPMGTDPAFHRRGVGRALMNYAFSRMNAEGMTEVRVFTDAYRQDAVGFYTALGFDRIADLNLWKPSPI